MEVLNVVYEKRTRRRLDNWVASLDKIHSRSYAAKLIENGNVKVNGEVIDKNSTRLCKGDHVEVCVEDLSPEIKVEPEDVDFEVLYENDDFLIIDKPPGVVVHPGAGNLTGTLVSGLVKHWGEVPEGLDRIRPGIVHRLDKDTSGVLIVAKTPQAVAYYSSLFKRRKIRKEYLALVYGEVTPREGKIIKNIARHRGNRTKMTVSGKARGRYAETVFKVEDYYVNPDDKDQLFSFLRIQLRTGRTHQIRVHFKHLGHPVVGDEVYAGRKMRSLYPVAERQLLHAYSLKFIDMDGVDRKFESGLPRDFGSYLDSLEQISSHE